MRIILTAEKPQAVEIVTKEYHIMKILECRRFSTTYPLTANIRVVKDYEIDLEMGEERIIVIDGIEHPIRRGNVCVRKPGQTVYGKGTQSSILLTIDFSDTQSPDHYTRNVSGPIQTSWDNGLLDDLNGVIVPHSEFTFIPVYTELLRVAFTDTNATQLLVMELLYKLNAEVCRKKYTSIKAGESACNQVYQYIKDNLNENISLESLAALVHLNKNHLVRLFKASYGKPPITMLIDMRMEHACDLVTNTDMSIAQIATACGYSAPSYFIAEYKKHFGITPLKNRFTNTSLSQKAGKI